MWSLKEYAKKFYTGKAWARCREAYRRSVGGLCEVCLQEGRYTPGVIVHHVEHINPDNVTDPRVLLDWSNLQLVCRSCHQAIHARDKGRRYTLDELGRVIL